MVKMQVNKIYNLYLCFLKKYGKPQDFWLTWCKDKKTLKEKERIVLGAILTQRTNWHNVEKALKNLERAKCLSLKKIYELGKKDISRLVQLVRPSGFYQQKAKRLFDLSRFIVEKYKTLDRFFRQDVSICRQELLAIFGIGKETADDILLYAGNKPIFVIDEYTRRFARKRKLSQCFSYDCLQQLFQKSLPKDIKIYRNFHAMLVLEGRGTGWDLISAIRQKKIL